MITDPRTLSRLEGEPAGVGTALGEDVLGRIDEIIPPGTDLKRA
ncbi:hypothetical protein [Streptomyces sp. 8N706]